jgi:hypothetical protein
MERPYTIDGDTGEVTRERWLNRPANRVELAVRRLRLHASVKLGIRGYVLEGGAFASPVLVTLDMLSDRDFTDTELDRLLVELAREDAVIGA